MTETEPEARSLEDCVERWLVAQMPIIQMHGGTSNIREADPDSGEVAIELGGTCSGCAISPRTTELIETEMVDDIEAVETVHVRILDADEGWNHDGNESLIGIDRREGGRGGRI